MGEISHCPWGCFEVLAESQGYKVKRINVAPGGCLSLQRHHFRAEHWFIVRGEGVVTVGDQSSLLRAGSAVDIPRKTKHRMANSTDHDLIFIEIQTGEYCGDDDIERFEDQYGRV